MESFEERGAKDLALRLGKIILFCVLICGTWWMLVTFWVDMIRGDKPDEKTSRLESYLAFGIALGQLWLLEKVLRQNSK